MISYEGVKQEDLQEGVCDLLQANNVCEMLLDLCDDIFISSLGLKSLEPDLISGMVTWLVGGGGNRESDRGGDREHHFYITSLMATR